MKLYTNRLNTKREIERKRKAEEATDTCQWPKNEQKKKRKYFDRNFQEPLLGK